MRRHPILLRLLTIGTLLALSAEPALALTGGEIIRDAAYDLILRFRPLILIVMIMTVIILGFTLLLSHEESGLGKAKSTLVATLIGGIIVTVILSLGTTSVSILYTGIDTLLPLNYVTVLDPANANAIGAEAEGVAGWLSTMAAVVGILIIIIAALRAFLSFGDEASYANVRKSLLHIVIGLIVIGGAYLLRKAFYAPSLDIQGGAFTDIATFTGAEAKPNLLMQLIKDKVMIILAILTIIAVAILIYAGLRMVISFGREEDFTAAKSLMLRVIAGLLIILLSFSLVWIVASIFS